MSETLTPISKLESELNGLRSKLHPLLPLKPEELPKGLKTIDPGLFERLVLGTGFQDGQVGASPETYRLILETISSTEDGQRICLESDISALDKVLSSKTDVEHESKTLLTREGLFPVTIDGIIVWVVWTGKIPCAEDSAAWADHISKELNLHVDEVLPAIQQVPLKSINEQEWIFQHTRKLRDTIQSALQAESRNTRLSEQLIQSERLRSLGALSSGVAHHFNNLLSIILGYSSFINNRETLTPDAQKAVRRISDAAQRGRRLTEELLAFSRSEGSAEEVISDVHDTLENVLSLLQSQVSSRIQISHALDAEESEVGAPASLTHQIIFNLLTNAIDSMPEGGALNLATRNRKIGSDQILYLSILLEDTGEAMPPDFDPLSEAKQTPAPTRDALKLSSIYGMVEKLEGTVTVASDANGTNTIEVLLPISSMENEGYAPLAGGTQIASSEMWVIDDDDIFREMCTQVLGDQGHTIVGLTNGPDMMDQLPTADKKPDLLIIDFSMPDFNGLEIREWMNQNNHEIPVILVSGFASHQPDIKKALDYPRTYFLQKPFSVPELADVVSLVLGETLITE